MKEFLRKNAFPILLSTTVVSSGAYIYSCGLAYIILGFALVSAVYSVGLFAMYDFLMKKGKWWITTISVVAVGIAAISLGGRLLNRYSNPMMWFMEPSKYNQVYPENITALVLMFGYVLISAIYYFTRVRYKSVYIFLICMCPFCLFAKTFTDIPVIFPIIITTLFFVIMIDNASRGKRSTSLYAASGTFIAIVTIIAAFLPKMEYAPYREQFDEFITGVNIGALGGSDFSDFSENSANTTSDDDTIVFEIYGDNPHLIRRQCFNLYNGTGNYWEYFGDSNTGHNNWMNYIDFENPSLLYNAVGIDKNTKLRECTIVYLDKPVRAIYTPDNMTSLAFDAASGLSFRDIYRNELDEYFLDYNKTGKAYEYSVGWAEFDIDEKFSADFTDEAAADISDARSVKTYINQKQQSLKYDGITMSEEIMSQSYGSADGRKRVKELAEEITGGCMSDYSRAKAIEEYFHSESYVYDDNFAASDGEADTFILKTRRGSCTSYATAMTLMCRELGMSARYVEGFLIQKYDTEKNCWYASASDSHAYVEVWIDGYGWTDFDPTSSNTDDGYFDATFLYVGGAALAIVLIGFMAVFLKPRIEEAVYVGKIKKKRGASQSVLIYNRINRKINSVLDKNRNTFTPQETAEQCEKLLSQNIDDFVAEYESSVYGNIDTNSDNTAVYLSFRKALKEYIKKKRR